MKNIFLLVLILLEKTILWIAKQTIKRKRFFLKAKYLYKAKFTLLIPEKGKL